VQILTKILGGGMSSRLFQEIREKRGLCYDVYAFHWAFADSGVLGVSAATGPDQIGELIPVIIDELKKAATDIVEEEVVRVRNQVRAGLLMSLESPSIRSSQLSRQQILWGRPIPMSETIERINNITAERVREVAMEILDNASLSIAGVGPIEKMPDYDVISKHLKS
jgi:predicted Zn-dependent peptidase